MNEEEQIKYYKKLYETETNPKIKEMLEHLIGMKERDISTGQPEELPDDQVFSPVDEFNVASQKQGSKVPKLFDPPPSQLDESPYTQTPQQRNLVSSINSEDSFETKGDNLEAGSSADNPIDSKTLTCEAQAQLPIGTWVTTAKGPHRINQGDKNWAKQMMQKTSGDKTTAPIADSKSSTGGTGKEKPATNKTGTVTTKPYYDTKDGVFKDHQTSTTIPASKADSFAGKHTQYTTKTMPKEQIDQMADPKVQLESAKARAHAEDAAKNAGKGAAYSLGDFENGNPGAGAVRAAPDHVMREVPIKQMPEVMSFLNDEKTGNLIKSVIAKGGGRKALNANLTLAQLSNLIAQGSPYFGSNSPEGRAIFELKKIMQGIGQSQEMDADYENFLKTGKTSMAY